MENLRRRVFDLLTKRRLIVSLLWLVSLAVAFRGGAYAYAYRTTIRSFVAALQTDRIIQTSLYNVRVQKLSIPAEGRDGGIAALRDGILFANRKGAVWFIDHQKSIHLLSLRVPVNVAEFEADPYNADTKIKERFAVKDILVQTREEGFVLTASHNYWHQDKDCYTLRVSSIEVGYDQLGNGTGSTQGHWKTLFETTPCFGLTVTPSGSRNPTLGAGGRLAALSDQEILLTVGGFGPGQGRPQELDNSYGKIVLLDRATAESRIFTWGHRNPQGIAVTSDSVIWSTGHGDRGGDELNLIVEGNNYGYPLVTYGTQYEALTWPLNPRQGRHDSYEKPIYAWVPSIGISEMIAIEGDAFPYWKGDLLVSSLAKRSLYRVRIENGRVRFVEPIPIGHRIRDIVEASDGSIVLKTDDNFLVYLQPIAMNSTDTADLDPALRGQILAGQCQGCHTFESGSTGGIGPNLWEVVGRPVASLDDFQYSDALRAVGGRWTMAALRSFLQNPDSFAPGNVMEQVTVYDDEELSGLIAYLQTLR